MPQSTIPARILIVDDHEVVREGIRTLITRTRPEWEVCGEGSDGLQAIELVKTLKPAVVVLDVTMPKMSGVEAASRIAKLGEPTRVLMFTMHESGTLLNEVRRSGAHGLVRKSQASRDLIRAIECLLRDEDFFVPEDEPAFPVV
jgi:DNA-binding NarL/FixJ family response regulator